MEQQWSDKTSTWFRSLKVNASRPNPRRSYLSDQLPKLPPPPEETLYPTTPAAATNHSSSRLALPPLLSTRSASNSSKIRAATPLQSWLLLPAVSNDRPSRHNHKPTSTSSSKSSSTCSSSSAARLPPLALHCSSYQANNKAAAAPVTRQSDDDDDDDEAIGGGGSKSSLFRSTGAENVMSSEQLLALLNTNELYDHIQPCLNSGGDDVFPGEQQQQQLEKEVEEELTSFAAAVTAVSSQSTAAVSSSIQWSIDWSLRRDSTSIDSEQNVEEEEEEEEAMASSTITERMYWNSARVRHSPPPPPLSPTFGNETSPAVAVVSPRAKSCYASLSQQQQQQTNDANDDGSDEIIEQIENVLDAIGISSSSEEYEEEDDDPPSHATFYRLEENEDGSEMTGYDLIPVVQPSSSSSSSHQSPPAPKKKFLKEEQNGSDAVRGDRHSVVQHLRGRSSSGSSSNSSRSSRSRDNDDEASKTPASLPTYRRQPDDRMVEEDCDEEDFLPNRIQEASPGTTASVSGNNSIRNRVVHSPIEGSPFRFSGLGKSKSVAAELSSINGAAGGGGGLDWSHSPTRPLSPADDDMDRRLRSLPARRKQSKQSPSALNNNNNNSKEIRRTTVGVMPSARGSVTTLVSRNNRFSLPPVSTPAAYDLQQQQQQHQPPPSATASSSSVIGPVDPRVKLQAILRTISSTEWEDKVSGIRRLEELTASNPECISNDVHLVALSLIAEIKNLRSQVSRAAIQCVSKLFQYCAKYMEQDLDRLVPLLLNKSGDTNRFIRDDAHSALMSITEYASPPRAIIAITAEGLSHKSSTVRAEAARLMAAIVDRLGAAKSLSGTKDVTERILPAAAHFIQDGSLDARAAAKRMFLVLMSDPVFDRAAQKHLAPSVMRNIQRSLDQLRKNGR